MNGLLKRIDPKKLVGLTFKYSEDRKESYTILESNFYDGKLRIFLLDKNHAQKDVDHIKAFKELMSLREHLSLISEFKNGNLDNHIVITRLKYAYVEIENPLLRNCEFEDKKTDMEIHVNNENDPFRDYNDNRKRRDEILTIEDLQYEFENAPALIKALRKIFLEYIGGAYKNSLRDYYLTLLRKNIQQGIDNAKEEIIKAEEKLKNYRKTRRKLENLTVEDLFEK